VDFVCMAPASQASAVRAPTELQTPVINPNPTEIPGLMVPRAALGANEVIE
jgi:hypothetical protein